MSTLFISDLHLSAQEPALTRLFLYFLREHAQKADALYILGDLFETWIGDDDESPYNQQMMGALAQLSASGVKTYFMPGNRDFLIGSAFLKKTGFKLLKDPSLITLYGTPTLLTHGDSLCVLDKDYMAFRRFTRKRWVQTLFLSLPLFLRRKIARFLRGKNHPTLHRQDAKYDVVMEELFKAVKQFSAQLIIHGHTHQPSIQLCNALSSRTGNASTSFQKRFVLSDWTPTQGNALIALPNGDTALFYFS